MTKQVSKRAIWEIIKKDGFLKMLAEKFGCSGVKTKGVEWRK